MTDRLIAVTIGLGLFVMYGLGACRSIYVGDSGELVAAVHTLGIPHPSGYPLYVLLGKLWTVLLPFGSVGLRMSLFSAACAAISCAVLYSLCRVVECSRTASVSAALLAAFGPSFWSQANIQRVYTLNALFLVMTLFAILRWYRQRSKRWLVFGVFLCSLGAANHTFMGAVWLVVIVWTMCSEPKILKDVRTLCELAFATAVGLTPYLFLYWRSSTNPRLDWGNPETLSALIDVMLRRDFWHRRYFEGFADLWPIGADYASALVAETICAGVVLAIIAIATRRNHQMPVALPLLIMAANFFAMAMHGSRADLFIWHRYYIPSFLMLALLAGVGLQVLSRIIGPRTISLGLVLPLFLFATGFADYDRSRYRIAEDFSRRLLAGLPPGATLVASDDNILFVLIYLQLVEGIRADVDVVFQGVGGADLPSFRFDPEEDAVFFAHHPNWDLPSMKIVPTGMAFRIWRDDLPPLTVAIDQIELEGASDPGVPKDYLTRNLISHHHYMLGMSFEDDDWTSAEREFRIAREWAPTNDVLLYNLGLVYRRAGLLERSLKAFNRASDINPRHMANQNKVRPLERAEKAKLELEAYEEILTNFPLPAAEYGSESYHLHMSKALASEYPLLAIGHQKCADEISAGITDVGRCGSI